MNDRVDIQSVLSQIRSIRSQTQAPTAAARALADIAPPSVGGANKVQPSSFREMFSEAVNKVNETQAEARELATSFELGDPKVSLTQVMIAAEKSSVSFQALTQVRNKVVSAYQDIMNMPM